MLANTTGSSNQDEKNKSGNNQISVPSISLPKGGGAIRGIGEKFAANPVTGTGSTTVEVAAFHESFGDIEGAAIGASAAEPA